MLSLAPAVADQTLTTGTGPLALAGTPFNLGPGLQSFAAAYGAGTVQSVPYALRDAQTGLEWEIGIGTLTGGNTLARTYVLGSSNGGQAVNLGGGQKIVYVCALPQSLPKNLVIGMQSVGPLAASAGASVGLTTDGQARNAYSAFGPANGILTFPDTSGRIKVEIDATGSSGAGGWGADYLLRYYNQGGVVTADAFELVGGAPSGFGSGAAVTFALTASVTGAEIALSLATQTGSGSETWTVAAIVDFSWKQK
jgi:hypothetical protein